MEEMKKLAGTRAVEFVREGMTVGLGTGSTAYYALEALGRLVEGGCQIRGVATSRETESIAVRFGIRVVPLDEVDSIDLAIDGADEVDPSLNLIKGMGGALLREKMVACASRAVIIVIDDSKLVGRLGTKSPLPVEVVPFGHTHTRRRLEALGCSPKLRGGEKPFVTDNGNYIYDCRFDGIGNPHELEKAINGVTGVVESGLFLDIATRVIVGRKEGCEIIER